MSDRRRLAANGRVAAAHLRGQVKAAKFTAGAARQVIAPVADLLCAPDGPRDRQLIAGQRVQVFEDHMGWAFVQSAQDDYVGYVESSALGLLTQATHRVHVRACHVYDAPDFKSCDLCSLSLGSLVTVRGMEGGFADVGIGFVPMVHLAELAPEPDPVSVAERLLGTPYLWGGNSAFGIDCSGLVQAGCMACAIPCPGDSDMQEAEMGVSLEVNAPLQRGDLLFWKGHVAWVVDETLLLHANAFHMAVAYEPIEEATLRILAQADGPVTARKRLITKEGI